MTGSSGVREESAEDWPIIPGTFPDPSMCRVGEDYFLANSSFEWFPAIPIWRSTNLIDWELVGNALDRPSQFPAGQMLSSKGVFAPTLRFHNDRFWLATTIVGEESKHVLYSAPRDWYQELGSAWSDPVVVEGIGGIDPDLAWDQNGTCYLTYCTSAPGEYEISQVRLDLETGTPLEEPRVIWTGTGLQWPEGPHLYQVGDWWYLLIAEGGTERGHVISVARSRSPEGPFEGHPKNPIFTRRSTDHPVMSVGHGDLVQTPEGDWVMPYLGVKPRGALPGFHVNGRETFLAGIDWEDGWPVVVPDRHRARVGATEFTQKFGPDSKLSPFWTSPGHAPSQVATPRKDGLQLTGKVAPNGAPSGLGFRVRDEHWSMEVDVATAGTPALRLRQDELHWYEVGISDGKARAHLQIGDAVKQAEHPVEGETCTLTLRSVPASQVHSPGPDEIELLVKDDVGEHLLLRVDGRYLSTEVAGGFIGRLALIHAGTGTATVHEARYRPLGNKGKS